MNFPPGFWLHCYFWLRILICILGDEITRSCLQMNWCAKMCWAAYFGTSCTCRYCQKPKGTRVQVFHLFVANRATNLFIQRLAKKHLRARTLLIVDWSGINSFVTCKGCRTRQKGLYILHCIFSSDAHNGDASVHCNVHTSKGLIHFSPSQQITVRLGAPFIYSATSTRDLIPADAF